jgi:hypothetical protein
VNSSSNNIDNRSILDISTFDLMRFDNKLIISSIINTRKVLIDNMNKIHYKKNKDDEIINIINLLFINDLISKHNRNIFKSKYIRDNIILQRFIPHI